MRRVYYAYALRMLMSRTAAYLAALALALLVFAQMVSVSAVFHNMLSVRVGEIHRFFISAFLNTEVWTLLVLGVCVVLFGAIVREVQRGGSSPRQLRMG